MRDVAVGKADPQDPGAVAIAGVLDVLEDAGAEAAGQDVLLDRDDEVVLGGEAFDQLGVERLGEAGVGDGRGDPVLARGSSAASLATWTPQP